MSWFSRNGRWMRRGLLLLAVPLTALACHGRHSSHHDLSEEEMREHIDDGVDFVLGRVDATDAQKAKIRATIEDALPEVVAFREERKHLTNEMQIELRKQDIDRERLEVLRAQAIDLANRASLRGLALLADVGDELTPEQRQRLVAHWQRHTRG